MEINHELFERLKGDNEHWHVWDDRPEMSPFETCIHCGVSRRYGEKKYTNPNLTTWEGFGWLRKAMRGRGDWFDFLVWLGFCQPFDSQEATLKLFDYFTPTHFRAAVDDYFQEVQIN